MISRRVRHWLYHPLRALGVVAVCASLRGPASGEPAAGGAATKETAGVDLRPRLEKWGLPPRSQGARPTCSAMAVAGALEFALAGGQGQATRLSPEFLNWAANQAAGGQHDGGNFADLWKGFVAHGICAENRMPYRARFEPAVPPDAAALDDARTRAAVPPRLNWIKEWDVKTGLTAGHLLQIKRTLGRGWPVCAGLRWPRQEQWVGDVLQMCPPDQVFDGHSVLVVGYRDDGAQPGGGVLVFRNSARGGADGAMPYAYAIAYTNDAAWVEPAEPGGAAHRPPP